MFRNKLLDSWDEKQFILLFYLSEHENNSTKEECYKYLNVSPKTLLKICDSLELLSNENHHFTIDVTQNRIKINYNKQKNLSNIFFSLLSRSIKFMIIKNLFNYDELHSQNLQEILGISRSTLYRNVSELNEILEVFKLQINNKTLNGSESQIRHFFIDYCTNFIPHDYLVNNLRNEKILEAVNMFEERFHLSLDPVSNITMVIYFSIIKKRYSQDKISERNFKNEYPFSITEYDNKSRVRFINSYKSSFVFKDISDYLNDISKNINFINSEEENIMFFFFLLGNNILPTSSKLFNQIISIQDSSNSQLTKIIGDIINLLIENDLLNGDDLFLQKEISDQLNIVCWNQVIYYGGIYLYKESDFERLLRLKKFDSIRNYVINFLKNEHPELSNSPLRNQKFIDDLLLIFLHASNHSSRSYKIGVSIQGDMIQSNLIQSRIISRLNSLGFVVATKVHPLSNYDLIVSNINSPKYKKQTKDYYLVNRKFTDYDLTELENVIKENVE